MFLSAARAAILLRLMFAFVKSVAAYGGDYHHHHQESSVKKDISLWIDEQQIKIYSGFEMQILVIKDGFVMQHLLDPNFEKYLPVIPGEVASVNFTWTGGERRYYYMFDALHSFNPNILHDPVISIPTSGFVPQKPSVFRVLIDCVGNVSGVASFTFGLTIVNAETSRNLTGTPIRLKLQKQCFDRAPDPECDRKCGNGKCNKDKICVCPSGFVGKYCESALCYPQCMNGGTCVAPGVCVCSPGFHGLHCEGGLCSEKCLNGGKCTQKDKCSCRKGYYGTRCQYSKCLIPCLNGGRCVGVNKCRCRRGFAGNQCQSRRQRCKKNENCPERAHKKKPKRKFV